MIIFGTRGITTTPKKGDFYCPSCNSTQKYGLKRVRRFFTLYFIPLIPLNTLGEYVECTSCKDTYKPNVLNYDPAAQAKAFEAEYHAAIKKVMIHMLLADGVIENTEIVTAQDIYHHITGNHIATDAFLEEISAIRRNKEDFSSMLNSLQGSLNEVGKELVIKAAIYVAMADGHFQEDERLMLTKIGKDLGMTQAHLQGVINSIE